MHYWSIPIIHKDKLLFLHMYPHVSRIKYKVDKNTVIGSHRNRNSGHRRITTPRDEGKIRGICLWNRRKCTKEFTRIKNKVTISRHSARTTRRYTAGLGFNCSWPTMKPSYEIEAFGFGQTSTNGRAKLRKCEYSRFSLLSSVYYTYFNSSECLFEVIMEFFKFISLASLTS